MSSYKYLQLAGKIENIYEWNLSNKIIKKETNFNQVEYVGTVKINGKKNSNKYKWIGKQTNNEDSTQNFDGYVEINGGPLYYIKFDNAKYDNPNIINNNIIKSNFLYNRDNIINKEELNKVLYRDIPDLDQSYFVYDNDHPLDKNYLENDIKILILFYQIYNYLQDKLKENDMTKISKKELFDNLKLIDNKNNKYNEINKIFNSITNNEELDIVLKKLNNYKKYFEFTNEHIFLVRNNYDKYINNIILSDNDYFLTTIKKNNDNIFTISFSKNFIHYFKSNKIKNDKKREINYTGIWFTTDPYLMIYYLDNSFRITKNFTNKDYEPTFNYFSINKDIPNIMVLSNDCVLNMEIIKKTIKILNIKDIEDNIKNKILDNYINKKGGCVHGEDNYYFAFYIYELNKINLTKINGWINIIDSSEIFISNPNEFLTLKKYKKIYKIIDDYNNIIYDKKIFNKGESSVNGKKFYVDTYNNINDNSSKKEEFISFENDNKNNIKSILPTLCNISNGLYIDIKPI